jgi:hypothetical protein
MTREELIALACRTAVSLTDNKGRLEFVFDDYGLESFAAAIATAERDALKAQRQPLTDEQIDALELPESGTGTIRDLVRVVEKAHGIGGDK